VTVTAIDGVIRTIEVALMRESNAPQP